MSKGYFVVYVLANVFYVVLRPVQNLPRVRTLVLDPIESMDAPEIPATEAGSSQTGHSSGPY